MQTAILVHFKKKKIVHTYSKPGRPLWEKYMKEGYKMVSMVSAFNASFKHDPQYKGAGHNKQVIHTNNNTYDKSNNYRR